MSLISGLLESFFHGGELLDLGSTVWFLDSLNLNDQVLVSGSLGLKLFRCHWLSLDSLSGLRIGHLSHLLPRLLGLLSSFHGFLL